MSQNRTLLIVDDDASVRHVMREMLKGMDFTIREVADGFGALAVVSSSRPALIILDLILPGMNGLQVLDKLREEGILNVVPVVAITGSITPEPVIRDLGARGVLRKPFARAELRGVVETVLRRGRLNRERPMLRFLSRLRRPAPILIVEDDPGVLRLLESVLHTAGYETVAATDGAEGLVCMRTRRPRTVLLDFMLPSIDGWQFRRRQLEEPALAGIPVLGITGIADADEVERHLGIRCFRKPLDVKAVLAEIDDLCQARSWTGELCS